MRETFLTDLLNFFMIALAAGSAQNLLLTRLVGGDHVFQMGSPRQERLFLVSQTILTLCASACFWYLDVHVLPGIGILERFGLSSYYARAYLWPVIAAVVIAFVYYTAYVIVRATHLLKDDDLTASRIPFVGFNSFVCAILFRIAANDFTLQRAMAFAFGSTIGYHLAVLLIWEGKKKMEDAEVPEAFQGLPSLLLYIAGIAMAIYALTGHGVATMM